MQVTITRRMAVTAAAVLALVGAGGAIAASGNSKGSSTASASQTCGPGGPGHGPRAGSINAVAEYLGLTKAELRTARENGTTLAQLATQQGKSVSGLKQAIYDAAKADLDKAVAAGRITSAQEKTMLSRLQSHLDEMVNSTGPPPDQVPVCEWRDVHEFRTCPCRPRSAAQGWERLRSVPWLAPVQRERSSSSTSSRSRTAATASRG